VPGSHKNGRMEHEDTNDESNVLFRGQSVSGIAEEQAVMCPLQPGEASFHHGWTLHASMPNRSDDRRIGFNVQYIDPSARQTLHDLDTATLVRGQDRFNHYTPDVFADGVMGPEAIARHERLEKLRKVTWASA
ncbi:MAG: phytanoyl-CoA dioxygenase family protein, partial [Rhizobiaceae bacterium]